MTAHALSLPRDFEDFVAILNQHGVDVVLVGGYALGVHGFVRATADIDFLYRCTVANVDQLCTALRKRPVVSKIGATFAHCLISTGNELSHREPSANR